MRSDVRTDRVAGNKLTGTLTSPNVKVPDQNGRAPASCSSGSALLRDVLGSAFLLLSQRLDTLRQYAVECRGLRFRLHCSQLRRATFRFLLDEFHHALAILILVFLWLELSLQDLDELLRHCQLLLRWRGAGRFREIVCQDHFVRIAERKQKQVIIDCTKRARVIL